MTMTDLRMCRNVTQIIYNARKNVNATPLFLNGGCLMQVFIETGKARFCVHD